MATEQDRNRNPDYCLYGAKVLLTQVKRLQDEIEGVRDGRDIECVHRMRVATRRTRAALPLFRDCFTKKEFRQWQKGIRGLTRALGAARDTDVQIEFLEDFISNIPENFQPPILKTPATPVGDAGTANQVAGSDVNVIFGLEYLLLRLRQQREAQQPGILSALNLVEEEGMVNAMEERLGSIVAGPGFSKTDFHSIAAYETAFVAISMAIDTLIQYDDFVPDASAADKHHAMRIAAKHLRYTMECYDDLLEGALKEAIITIKGLQDILGELHDCDVWIIKLTDFEEEERSRSLSHFDHDTFHTRIEPGLTYLSADRQKSRLELHSKLVTYWAELKDRHILGQLRSVIGRPLPDRPSDPIELSLPADENSTTVIALIGDVHANLPALEAVLTDAREHGATAILNAGDFIGYGAFPDEVITVLRQVNAISVIGNYDMNILRSGENSKPDCKPGKHPTFDNDRLKAVSWTYQRLSGDNLEYLRSLPTMAKITVGDMTILLTHGSQDSITEYIGINTGKIRLHELAATAKADIVVSGHSHRPFAREVGGVWFVNTGSVGRPNDGDNRASYAVLQLNPFGLYHFRVSYDVERAVAATYEHNLPEAIARSFRDGLPLDIVKRYDATDNRENRQ